MSAENKLHLINQGEVIGRWAHAGSRDCGICAAADR
jgi:hypothetical protein